MFNFKNENDEIMEINLTYNKLDQSCFAIDSLINFKRPTKLILLKNQIKYLIEEIFKPFLNANKLNTRENRKVKTQTDINYKYDYQI